MVVLQLPLSFRYDPLLKHYSPNSLIKLNDLWNDIFIPIPFRWSFLLIWYYPLTIMHTFPLRHNQHTLQPNGKYWYKLESQFWPAELPNCKYHWPVFNVFEISSSNMQLVSQIDLIAWRSNHLQTRKLCELSLGELVIGRTDCWATLLVGRTDVGWTSIGCSAVVGQNIRVSAWSVIWSTMRRRLRTSRIKTNKIITVN